MTKQNRKSNFSFLLLVLVIIMCLSWLAQMNQQNNRMEYLEIRQLFLQEKVETVKVEENTLVLGLHEEINGSKTVYHELYD